MTDRKRKPNRPFPSILRRVLQRGVRGLLIVLVLLATMGATVADLNEAGKAAYARGDYAAAERLFSQAITQAPDEPLLHYHRAVALTRLNHWKEAVEAYETVLRLGPSRKLAAAAREGLRTLAPLTRTGARRAPDPGEAPIPLRRAGGGWVTEVVLDDTKTARFLVDTGAAICVISPGLADTLGIKPGRRATSIELQTLAGRTRGLIITIPLLRVGEAEAEDVTAVIHPMGSGLDGILGNSFLSNYRVTLDPERGVLQLRPR